MMLLRGRKVEEGYSGAEGEPLEGLVGDYGDERDDKN
jgi:hypothetical protein